MLFPVGDIGDTIAAQGIEIDLCLSQLSENHGGVTRSEWAFASIAICDSCADEEVLFQPTRYRFSLRPGGNLHIKLRLLISRSDEAKLHPIDCDFRFALRPHRSP